MNEELEFIEQLLRDSEEKEKKLTQANYDLLLFEITKLQAEMKNNSAEADKEVEIIKNWALAKNSKLQEMIEYQERKLEAYIREEELKTIDLPHGILKMHKKPDKVEVTDIELFLASATSEMLSVVPQTVRPDLNKIKSFIKTHRRTPTGVTVIEGKEEFTYKLKQNGEDQNNGTQET
jgi:hypothetical protein